MYLFTSARLGFRNWKEEDKIPFAAMCADPAVMEFFPSVLTKEETNHMIKRMQLEFEEHQTTFFAVDLLESQEFIGFIGLLHKKTACDFAETPCMEIGWRLKKAAWGNGYATEGALRCLQYSKEVLNFSTVYSITPIPNVKSERIMKKIGMHKTGEFDHPKLQKETWLTRHVIYKIAMK